MLLMLRGSDNQGPNNDNFEGELPLFDSQLVKLKFVKFCGDDPKVWPTRVEQFFDYQIT